jgi:hypothetical protein
MIKITDIRNMLKISKRKKQFNEFIDERYLYSLFYNWRFVKPVFRLFKWMSHSGVASFG